MFYSDTLRSVGEVAAKKTAFLRANPFGYFVSSMLAGAYVGVGVFLVFSIGAPLKEAGSPWLKTIMGVSFAVALSLVIFAGAELFTGNNLVMAVGWWRRRNTFGQLLAIWGVSWVGNLVGSALLAALLYYATILNTPEGAAMVQGMAGKKMSLSAVELLTRGILCNWLVCLAVWCGYRLQSETAKLIMIFWCLYAFIASGFEHSVANMTLFALALFQHMDASLVHNIKPEVLHAVSINGALTNLLWVTIGNIIGGALFVGGAYWIAGHLARREMQLTKTQLPNTPVASG